MLAKLALAIFIYANGALSGPLGVAVVDEAFPTVEACEKFKGTDEGVQLHDYVQALAHEQFGPDAVVKDECVPVDPDAVKHKGDRDAYIPTWGTAS